MGLAKPEEIGIGCPQREVTATSELVCKGNQRWFGWVFEYLIPRRCCCLEGLWQASALLKEVCLRGRASLHFCLVSCLRLKMWFPHSLCLLLIALPPHWHAGLYPLKPQAKITISVLTCLKSPCLITEIENNRVAIIQLDEQSMQDSHNEMKAKVLTNIKKYESSLA